MLLKISDKGEGPEASVEIHLEDDSGKRLFSTTTSLSAAAAAISETCARPDCKDLRVRIESSRAEFFEQPWELGLADVATDCVRCVTGAGGKRDYPELVLQLKVRPPAAPDSRTQDEPLRVLQCMARPAAGEASGVPSNAFNLSLQSVQLGGAIDWEILSGAGWNRVKARIASAREPVHVFHYDGPIVVKRDEASLLLSRPGQPEEWVDLREVVRELVRNRVRVLAIDACGYSSEEQPISAQRGLATIARIAGQESLGNIVGLAQLTDPWTRSACFEALYRQITLGLPFGRAVVEARKASSGTLVHYGGQALDFFESPQTHADPQDPNAFREVRRRLFGFRSEMLPPLLDNATDGGFISVLEELTGGHGTATAIGAAGLGKTHLAHLIAVYLATRKTIDHAFYFDYRQTFYSHEDIVAMIAPIVNAEGTDAAATLSKLRALRCLFVFDNLADVTNEPARQDLEPLLGTLQSSGQYLLSTGQDVGFDLGYPQFRLQPLQITEQRVLAAAVVKRGELAEKIDGRELDVLSASAHGNPWLLKKLVSSLSSSSVEDVQSTAEALRAIDHGSVRDAYWEQHWSQLPRAWRALLLMCSELEDLLLEIIMVAADQKEPFEPARRLLASLGDENGRVGAALERWEAGGFLRRLPHGRIIDSDCRQFLDSKRAEAEFEEVNTDAARLHLSQLACEGIRMLSSHVVASPNPVLSHYLLANRRRWAELMERLWFAGDFRGVLRTKSALEGLLEQARLRPEIAAWSLDLIKRSPLPTASDAAASRAAEVAWVVMATDVLMHLENAQEESAMIEAARVWSAWFESHHESVDRQQLALFYQVARFLEVFHGKSARWRDCIAVCERAQRIYSRHGAWGRVAESLRSLAAYHLKSGDELQASRCEQSLIQDVQYGDQTKIKAQYMLEILLARIARGATTLATEVLAELRAMPESKVMQEILDRAASDIEAAVPAGVVRPADYVGTRSGALH